MKLYYMPGACSLSDHIALHEGGFDFTHDRVDHDTKTTESGRDFAQINPRGYVPALEFDDGSILTENVAILDWIAGEAPSLVPEGALGRSRVIEALAFFGSELHKNFGPFFSGADEAAKAKARDTLGRRFGQAADMLEGDYLFGSRFSVADAYLFVMTTWADKADLSLPEPLKAYSARVRQRPAVQKAMKHEGLLEKA